MENNEVARDLEGLGLSKVEAMIYLVSVKSTNSTIEEMANKIGTPLSETERAVEHLVELGLLKFGVEPNRFEATTPTRAIRILEKERVRHLNSEVSRIQDTAQSLRRLLQNQYTESRIGMKPEELLDGLPSLSEMELRTVRMVDDAEHDVAFFTASFGWYDKIREAMQGALNKGISIRALMTVPDERSQSIASELSDNKVNVRVAAEDWYPLRGTIVDSSQAVFVIWASQKGRSPMPVYYKPTYTRNIGLVKVFQDAFDRRWEMASPFKRQTLS